MQCLWLAQLSYCSFVNQSDSCCVLGYFCLYGMCHMFRSARGTHERVLIPIQQFLLEPRRPFRWHKSISKDPLFSASFCHLRPGPCCWTDQHMQGCCSKLNERFVNLLNAYFSSTLWNVLGWLYNKLVQKIFTNYLFCSENFTLSKLWL